MNDPCEVFFFTHGGRGLASFKTTRGKFREVVADYAKRHPVAARFAVVPEKYPSQTFREEIPR
jgi:hypothetical protein